MNELSKALVAAQADMPNVEKRSTNPHFKSKFASLDDIIQATRPVLNAHGLSIQQFPSTSELGAPTLVTRLTHSSGEALEYAAPLFLQGQDMQKYGAALTYARRYAWAAALGIATDEDDDGNHASSPAPARQETPAAANGAKVISEAQRKRLYAMSKEEGLSDDELKQLVLEVAGVDSSKDIPVAKYDALCDAVRAEGVPF